MHHLLRAALITALLSLPSLTAAQTLDVFDITGNISLANGTLVGTFSGTFDFIPRADGDIVSWNIAMPSLSGPGGSFGAVTFTTGNSQAVAFIPDPDSVGGDFTIYENKPYSTYPYLYISFPCVSFNNPPCINFVGGNPFGGAYYGSEYYPVGNGSTGFNVSGEITPAGTLTITPEPSALVLTGSGLIGIVAFRRRCYTRLCPKTRISC